MAAVAPSVAERHMGRLFADLIIAEARLESSLRHPSNDHAPDVTHDDGDAEMHAWLSVEIDENHRAGWCRVCALPSAVDTDLVVVSSGTGTPLSDPFTVRACPTCKTIERVVTGD